MNELFIAFSNSLIALAICLAAGFFCRKKRMLNEVHSSGMSTLLTRITMPCMVFMSFMRPFSRELLMESISTVVITGVIFIIAGFAGLWLAKLMKATPGERQNWQFGIAYPNVGFMGIPIVLAVFGTDGLIYAAMTQAAFCILAFTVGVRMYDDAPKGFKLKELLVRSPAVPATAIGFVFFLTGFRLPWAIESGIDLIGGVTTPLSMIIIGAALAQQSLKDSFTDVRLLPPVGLKLVVIPIISLLILRLFIPNPLMLSVIVTLMAMPPAAATAIFAEEFKADSLTAAKFVVVCTMLCLITVPLISLLL